MKGWKQAPGLLISAYADSLYPSNEYLMSIPLTSIEAEHAIRIFFAAG